jgi:hypothetical protein
MTRSFKRRISIFWKESVDIQLKKVEKIKKIISVKKNLFLFFLKLISQKRNIIIS